MGLVRSLMSFCEVGLVGLSSGPHTVQCHQQPGHSKGQETKGTNPSPTARPCRSHLRENGRAVASLVPWGQLQTGSPAIFNNFCLRHTSMIKTIRNEICLSLIPAVCPGIWNYFRDVSFLLAPVIRQPRWGFKFLRPLHQTEKTRDETFSRHRWACARSLMGPYPSYCKEVLVLAMPHLTFTHITGQHYILTEAPGNPKRRHCCTSRALHLQANRKYHPAALQTHRTATAPLQLTRRGTGGAV